MKMLLLGKTGVKVSEICLGTLTFGGGGSRWNNFGALNQKEAGVLVDMALDAGVNFFDTADVYAAGLSEEILGKALGSRRNSVILATKVRGRTGPGPNDVRLSRHHIFEECDASLKRLGTDYIDLYQVHYFDFNTSLEETTRTKYPAGLMSRRVMISSKNWARLLNNTMLQSPRQRLITSCTNQG